MKTDLLVNDQFDCFLWSYYILAGGIGTCLGDSGGPFVVKDEDGSDKKWVLEGVSSWGGSKQCAGAHQYSGFLKVSNFVDWVNQFL